MIIISAGVVMNLIFAVILAGVAFLLGVPYSPTVVGGTMAGGPAWKAGLESGDQILGFDGSSDDPKLRYPDFSTGIVIRGLEKKDAPLTLAVQRGDERLEVSTRPTADYSKEEYYLIGLLAQSTPTVGTQPFYADSYLAKSQPDLQTHDLITAVDDVPLTIDPRFGQALGTELTDRFQAKWREPVKLTIQRPDPKAKTPKERAESSSTTLEIELPPVPTKTLGIGFATGPVTAVQIGSLADKAGVQVGDVLLAINGEPIVDALRIPDQVAQLAGQTVHLSLRRSISPANPDEAASENAAVSGSWETVEVAIDCPKLPSFDPISSLTGRLSLGGIGIAFDVLPEITYVDPAVAEKSGIAVGDSLAKYHWMVSEQEQKELSDRFNPKVAFQSTLIDSANNVPVLFDFLQSIPAGSQIKIFLKRDGKTREATLPVAYADDWFWSQRGVGLAQLEQVHEAKSVADAFQLGMWETKRRFQDVLNFLRLLLSGKIGAKGLGGPILIAQAASAEANNGVARLLIFLTLLSANLAILNFLPIPALDGGHMLFLTAEAIRGKPLSEALQVRLTMAGVLGLLSLMAFVIVNDILRQL